MSFPFSFSVPGEIFGGLKEEQPRLKRSVPRARSHGGGAGQVPTSIAGQEAVRSSRGSPDPAPCFLRGVT